MKRRDFIATAGAALLGTAAAGTRRHERVAIVGAGIAGLVTARRLRDAGIAATLYDSANRIGGRMHSERAYWSDGQHTEWCGAMIDSTHLTMHGDTALTYTGYMNGESFQQDGLTSYNGWEYTAYWDSSGHVNVSRRQLPSGAWQDAVLTDYTTAAGLKGVPTTTNIAVTGLTSGDKFGWQCTGQTGG